MYSLYIPKYKSDPTSVRILPDELARFMAVTGFQYDLLVSPGYLSTTDGTIEEFLSEMEKRLTTSEKETDLGLFYGMNGFNRLSGTTTSILDKHRLELSKGGPLKEFRVNPAKRKDHRKMIFFVEEKKKKEKEWGFAKTLDSGNKDAFLDEITVKAVLIGSSNFSYSTYLDAKNPSPSQGEADLLMFIDESYMKDVQDRLNGEIKDPIDSRVVLFTSIAGGASPEEYFKEMLKDFLNHALN